MNISKPLIQGAILTATAAVYYTAPIGTNTRITQFAVTNTDTVNRTVTIYLTPASAVPTTADIIISAKTLTPGETWVAYPLLGSTIAANGSIQALASAAGVVVVKASGVELT